MKIAVVGSGSKCWSLLKNKLNKFDILEIKAKSIDKIKINYKVDVVLYLADPPCNAINSHLNTTLAKLKPNKFILISSLVVELPDQFNFYRYVKRKKFIENELCNFRKIFKNTKFIYLRCSTIIPDKDIVKNIYPIYTNITQLFWTHSIQYSRIIVFSYSIKNIITYIIKPFNEIYILFG